MSLFRFIVMPTYVILFFICLWWMLKIVWFIIIRNISQMLLQGEKQIPSHFLQSSIKYTNKVSNETSSPDRGRGVRHSWSAWYVHWQRAHHKQKLCSLFAPQFMTRVMSQVEYFSHHSPQRFQGARKYTEQQFVIYPVEQFSSLQVLYRRSPNRLQLSWFCRGYEIVN